jgi:hypothetical protein
MPQYVVLLRTGGGKIATHRQDARSMTEAVADAVAERKSLGDGDAKAVMAVDLEYDEEGK